jgi:hypothetical protein
MEELVVALALVNSALNSLLLLQVLRLLAHGTCSRS